MAKGVEDCAFYRWSRLTSLNEVGGDPSVFSVDAEEFLAALPAAALAQAGHDTHHDPQPPVQADQTPATAAGAMAPCRACPSNAGS